MGNIKTKEYLNGINKYSDIKNKFIELQKKRLDPYQQIDLMKDFLFNVNNKYEIILNIIQLEYEAAKGKQIDDGAGRQEEIMAQLNEEEKQRNERKASAINRLRLQIKSMPT